jgi:hypothetical protein
VSVFECVDEAPGLDLSRCVAVPCVIVEVKPEDDVFALFSPLIYVLFEIVEETLSWFFGGFDVSEVLLLLGVDRADAVGCVVTEWVCIR